VINVNHVEEHLLLELVWYVPNHYCCPFLLARKQPVYIDVVGSLGLRLVFVALLTGVIWELLSLLMSCDSVKIRYFITNLEVSIKSLRCGR